MKPRQSLLKKFLEDLMKDPGLGPEIACRRDIPPRQSLYAPYSATVPPELKLALKRLGIARLYRHQAEAVARAMAGEDLVVVTPTASGKTLCYNLPVIARCLARPESRALYLFPMKALEQDQRQTFLELAQAAGISPGISAEIYDGDTPAHRRTKLKSSPPSVLISNPDMLHLGILPYHHQWQEFFRRLEYIVIDEVHTYRGVFGSHVAHVLRRLLRLAAHYGSRPSIIACSATIANPGELTRRLTGRQTAVVDDNGAPEAGRHFIFVNPRRKAASTTAALLLRQAVNADLATIVFTKARKMTELIYTWTIQQEPRLKKVLSAYRAGYLPEERRDIEASLFSGRLKGVISTSALEMGIDIGNLDVCILVGYPGAVTTTWQRGGRVGRQDKDSLVVLVAQQDALDQYFMKHPDVFFGSGFEPAVVDPANRPILEAHLACAAAELPLRRHESAYLTLRQEDDRLQAWDDVVAGAVAALEKEGRLLRSVDEDCWHSSSRYPQRDVGIRSMGQAFTIFEEPASPQGEEHKPRPIGSLDGHRAMAEGHPGAIYLHRAHQYEVLRMDLSRANLWVRRVEASYYTVPLRRKETDILGARHSKLVHNFVARLGDLKVTERVVGYEKKRIAGGERLSTHELELPSTSFETVGIWIEIDDFISRAVIERGLNFMGGIHAVEHAAIALFPLFALCERDDVGGISVPLHAGVGKAAVFIYDGYPGGVGLAERSFERIEELLERTLDMIAGCDCDGGCPSCIFSNKCGNGNIPLDKKAATTILALLLDKPWSREWLPKGSSAPEEDENSVPQAEKEPPAARARPQVLVLDIETRRGAGEVGGWGNAHLMGLAVAVVWDSRSESFRAYREDAAEKLIEDLVQADLVVGFNLLGFDYKVLSAYDNGRLAEVKTFDILFDLKKRLGWRLSLGHLAEHTLGASKTADGLQSLEWVKQGRLDLVEEYCRDDVRLTRDLFFHGLTQRRLRFLSKDKGLVELAVDWDLEKLAAVCKR